jgi:hypothetical protein
VPLRISRRTQTKFAEYATGWSTINQIARTFEAEGFEANAKQTDVGGQRRTTCASYHALIDPHSDSQQRRLLSVYLDAIDSWGGRQDDGSLAKGALDVVRSLQRDGVPVDDAGRLTGPIPAGDLELPDLDNLADPGVLEEHLERMRANIDRDTSAVIASAKELLESVCKVILDDATVTYPASATLPELYKTVAQGLRLTRDSVPANAKGSEAAQRVLQGLVTAVQNLAELRNAIGLGHGRAQRVPALDRHARLAMNASYTVAAFLIATWSDRKGNSGG